MMNGTTAFGIGVDIEDIGRFRNLDRERHELFFKKIFTLNELSYCFSKGDASGHLAARFAGKEAVIKALGNMGRDDIAYNDIEIIHRGNGAPVARIRTNGPQPRVEVSISHCEDKAMAAALVIDRASL